MAVFRRCFVLLASLLVLLLTSACGAADDGPRDEASVATAEADEGSGARTVEHELGESEIPTDPQRIVSVDSLTPAYLAELDIASVGACTEGGYVPEPIAEYYEGIETFDSCGDSLPYEQILALKPDVIVGLEDQVIPADAEAYERLSQIAPTVILPFGEDRVDQLLAYSDVFDRTDEAQAVVDDFNAQVDSLDLEGTFSMIALFAPGTFDLFQDNFTVVELLEQAGMQQVPDTSTLPGYDPEDNRVRQISLEQSDLLEGDHIIAVVATEGDLDEAVTEAVGDEPLWQKVPAVQNGQVVAVDGAYAFGSAGLSGFREILDAVKADVQP